MCAGTVWAGCVFAAAPAWRDADLQVKVFVSQYGYNPEHRKVVTGAEACDTFTVRRVGDDSVAFEGGLSSVAGDFGTFWQGDFTALRETGEYYVRIGTKRSPRSFTIAPHRWDNLQKASAWYYFGLRRMGEDSVVGSLGDYRLVNWEHARLATARGDVYKYIGRAWGDGDDGRIYPSASLVVAQYCALKETRPFWDRSDWIYAQVRWGLDGALSFLEKDGLLRLMLGAWPEHQNTTFDNRFYSGDEKRLGACFDEKHTSKEYSTNLNHEVVYTSLLIGPAYAVCLYRDRDPEFFGRVEALVKCGYERIRERYDPFPQKYSLGSWVWLNLLMWRMTGEAVYRERAVAEADRLLELQQNEWVGDATCQVRGWFRKDRQSTRNPWGEKPEQEVMITPWIYQGLFKLIEYLPEHPRAIAWRKSLDRYARDYLLALSRRNPFGYTPMKVEASGQAELKRHCGDVSYQYFAEIGRHFHQLGNAAFMLQVGKMNQDQELIAAAWQQLFWFAGANPMGTSLIHGFGQNSFSQQHHQTTLGRAFPGGMSNGATGDAGDEPTHARYNEYYTYANLNVLWFSTVCGAARFERPLELWPKEIAEAPHTAAPDAHARLTFPVRLKGGFTYPFMAVVRDDAENVVQWLVNGVPGGTPETGTFTADGRYTAPVVDAETRVTIAAVSRKDASVREQTAVTVMPVPRKVENLRAVREGDGVVMSWDAVAGNVSGYTVWRRLPVGIGWVGTIFEMVGAVKAEETGYRYPNAAIRYYDDQEPLPAGIEFLVRAYHRTPEAGFDYGKDEGGWVNGVWKDARAAWRETQHLSPDRIYGFGPPSDIVVIKEDKHEP